MEAAEVAVPATAIPDLTGARSSGGSPSRQRGADVQGERLELVRGGRVGVDVALAHAHDPDGQRGVKAGGPADADDELGGAAADVDHDGWLGGGLPTQPSGPCFASLDRSAGHGAEERELRLFVAAEDAGVEVKVLAHTRGEVGPVGGVAHGGGEHGEVGAGAVGVDRGAVVLERAKDPLDGLLGEGAVRVDAVAEAGDVRASEQLVHRSAVRVDVGDQQAGGVGADVNDGDAHARHARGVWMNERQGDA